MKRADLAMVCGMDTLAGFVLEGVLGEGTMGEVWRARAPDGTRVAIKVARKKVLADLRLLKLMDGEVRAMARLDHPYVTWVYDHGRAPVGGRFEPGTPYLVLEHCGGGTLVDRKPLSWEEVRALAAMMLDALGHAHAHGIVHRDLKPANILWSGPDDVRPGPKLADFGIAFAMGPGSGEASIAGTPWYMAPEQISRDERIGPWTDLYSLGAVLWEIVTGAPPYVAPELVGVILAARAGKLPAFVPQMAVPERLLPWLRILLARRPKERFRKASDALRALASVDPAVSPPLLTWRIPPRSGPRLRLQGAGLGLLPLREIDLAGRDLEREQLWRAMLRVLDTRVPEVVLLRGVSGIGKTRLMSWLAVRASELGLIETVMVPCRGYSPLQGILAGVLRSLGHSVVSNDDIVALLAQLGLDAPSVERISELLQGPHTRWGVVPAVRRALVHLLVEPRIVVLDDAHASESALRFARTVLADQHDVHHVPMLLVVCVEEEALERVELRTVVDALVHASGVRTIRLGPLSNPEQDQLVNTLGLSPEAHSTLVSSAGGHPGYLVTRVVDWVHQGVLASTPRGFGLVRTALGEVPVAQALAEMWERRLDQLVSGLPLASAMALELAAVIGREVDEELWEGASDDPTGELRRSQRIRMDPDAFRARIVLVDRLVASGVARETGKGFVFAHPALVDALIRRARSAGRLADHHRAIASQLRERPMPENALLLGVHLAEASQWTEAIDPLLDGIDWAWKHEDRRPLLSELERASRCIEEAALPPDDPRRIRVYLLRGVLLLGLGQMAEAEQAIGTAIEMAEARGDQRLLAQAVMRMCDIRPLRGDWVGAKPWFLRLLALESHAERPYWDKPYWGGTVRARLGSLAASAGHQEEAKRLFSEAEGVLKRCDQQDPSVNTALVELYAFSGQTSRLLEQTFLSEPILSEAGMLSDQAYVLYRRYEALGELGRHDESLVQLQRAIAISDQMGDLRASVVYRGQIASSAIARGQFADAHAVVTEAFEQLASMSNAWLESFLLLLDLQALLALRRMDDLDRCLMRIKRCVPFVPRSEGQLHEAMTQLASMLRERGDAVRATQFEEVIALIHTQVDATNTPPVHYLRERFTAIDEP